MAIGSRKPPLEDPLHETEIFASEVAGDRDGSWQFCRDVREASVRRGHWHSASKSTTHCERSSCADECGRQPTTAKPAENWSPDSIRIPKAMISVPGHSRRRTHKQQLMKSRLFWNRDRGIASNHFGDCQHSRQGALTYTLQYGAVCLTKKRLGKGFKWAHLVAMHL